MTMWKQLVEIVLSTGAAVTDAASVLLGENTQERMLQDVGVLRYPDPHNPYIKVYRLQLRAWRHCNRMLFAEQNSSRLDVEFNCRKYSITPTCLEAMKRDIAAKAKQEAENDELFG